jgi:hypothetical protein
MLDVFGGSGAAGLGLYSVLEFNRSRIAQVNAAAITDPNAGDAYQNYLDDADQALSRGVIASATATSIATATLFHWIFKTRKHRHTLRDMDAVLEGR